MTHPCLQDSAGQLIGLLQVGKGMLPKVELALRFMCVGHLMPVTSML